MTGRKSGVWLVVPSFWDGIEPSLNRICGHAEMLALASMNEDVFTIRQQNALFQQAETILEQTAIVQAAVAHGVYVSGVEIRAVSDRP